MNITFYDVIAVTVGLFVGYGIAAAMTKVEPPPPPAWIEEMEDRVNKMNEDHAARWKNDE